MVDRIGARDDVIDDGVERFGALAGGGRRGPRLVRAASLGAAAAAVGASARVPTAALLMGVYVAGGGLGIVVSGLAPP